MALDMLAQAYQAEDSQTMTTTLFTNDHKSDESDHEDTVIENIDDTVIQNDDTYIDQIIKSNAYRQHSESQTITSSPNTFLPYTSSHNIIHHTTTPKNYNQQPSQDFLLIIENFNKQLQEKTKENELLKLKMKDMTKDYDDVIQSNNELKQQITKWKQKEKNELNEKNALNDKISEQRKQIEEYEPIIKWLQIQIKTDSDSKIDVEMLEQWKNSMAVNYDIGTRQVNDDEKKSAKYENEKIPLLNNNIDTNDSSDWKNKKPKAWNGEKQFQTEKSKPWISCIPWSN